MRNRIFGDQPSRADFDSKCFASYSLVEHHSIRQFPPTFSAVVVCYQMTWFRHELLKQPSARMILEQRRVADVASQGIPYRCFK
jgi:hypothetical protein